MMVADGGDSCRTCGRSMVGAALFKPVASSSAAFPVIDRIASTQRLLDARHDAHALARERVWERAGFRAGLSTDVDATLICAPCRWKAPRERSSGGDGFYRCWPMAVRPALLWRGCRAAVTPGANHVASTSLIVRKSSRPPSP